MNEKSGKNNEDNKLIADSSASVERSSTSQASVKRQLEAISLYLPELSAAIGRHDIYRFRELAQKVKPLLNAVDLTDLAKKLQRLHDKCVTAQDLVLNEIETQHLMKDLTNNLNRVEAVLQTNK